MREIANIPAMSFSERFISCKPSISVIVDPDDFDIVNINSNRIKMDSICIKCNSAVGDALQYGTVIAPDFTAEIINDDGVYDRISFEGKEILVFADYTVDGPLADLGTAGSAVLGSVVTGSVSMGRFICDSAKRNGNNLVLTGLGEITKMDKVYATGDISFPITCWNMASALVTGCGLSLKVYDFGDGLQNRTLTIPTEPAGGKYTYRQLLGFVCEIMGCNALTRVINGTEKVVLRNYGVAPSAKFSPDNLVESFVDKNPVQEVAVRVIGKNGEATYGSLSPTYKSAWFTVKDNPFIDTLDQTGLDTVAQNLYYNANTAVWTPFTATALPNPLIEPMDAVTLFNEDGTTVYGYMPISGVEWSPNLNTKYAGVGFKEDENEGISPFTNAQNAVLDGMSGETQEVKEKTDAIADYVIETGTDGIWVYRKWNSGVAECWASVEVNVAAGGFSQTGNVYSVGGSAAYPTGLFVDVPLLQAFPGPSNKAYWVGNIRTDAESDWTSDTAQFCIYRGANTNTGGTFHISLYAIGRWKE